MLALGCGRYTFSKSIEILAISLIGVRIANLYLKIKDSVEEISNIDAMCTPIAYLHKRERCQELWCCHVRVKGLVGHCCVEEESYTSMKLVSTMQAILQTYWAIAPVV